DREDIMYLDIEHFPMYSRYFFKVGDTNYVVDRLRQFLYSRRYLNPPRYKVHSNVYDLQMASMVADYQAYQKTRNPLEFSPPVSGKLDEATYEAIGKEMTSFQIDAMSIHDINVKKLLYGVAMECLDICDSWATVAPVIAKDKFIGWGYGTIKENCF